MMQFEPKRYKIKHSVFLKQHLETGDVIPVTQWVILLLISLYFYFSGEK